MTRIAVLVSLGQHPVSGRSRPAPLDAIAVAVALQQDGASIRGLHAGPAEAAAPVLRAYLGMGLGEVAVLDMPATTDPLPALRAALAADPPDVVLAGGSSETGESSGMTPFWLAEALGWPIVTNIVGLVVGERRATLIQALPGGRRRCLQVSLPFAATVDRAAGPARLSAFGPARRGRLVVTPGTVNDPDQRHGWASRPARVRPKRLAVPVGAGADRLGAILGGVGPVLAEDGRQAQTGLDPEAAADKILDFLQREGLLRAARPRFP